MISVSNDLISREYLLQKLDLFNDRKNGNKHFLLGIETAKEIIGDEPAPLGMVGMACPNCGCKAVPWVKFCDECGQKFVED